MGRSLLTWLMRRRLSVAFGAAVALVALGVAILVAAPKPEPAPIASRHMIAAANTYAAEAGRKILRDGGSAVDAAIAAQLVLTLVEPQSSGIGGGLYLLVSDARGNMRAYDGRETAPRSASPAMFLNAKREPRAFEDVATGGLAVGVPGTIAALALAHRRYGKLPWRKLFAPAISLARNGFVVSRRLARAARALDRATIGPELRAQFFHADGSRIAAGETMRNLDLAKTLERMAAEGPRGFYKGVTATGIVNAVRHARANQGGMTPADLQNYSAKERTPLCGTYRAYRICSVPPSTSGGVSVLEILGLLKRFSSAELQPNTLSAIHLVTQAERLAYADRARWLGDPDFVSAPLDGLLSQKYLAARSARIDPSRDMGTAAAGTPPTKQAHLLDFAPQRSPTYHGTSHLSVVDDSGEVVSMTMSIQDSFGAQIGAGGFVLNNQLTDFSFDPTIDGRPVANAPAPGKRPLSAMGPMIVFDPSGKFFAALGTQGGQNIIAYNVQVLSALIDGKLTMPEAISLPHFLNTNGSTVLEFGTSLGWLWPRLEWMGHKTRIGTLSSGLNAIRRVPKGYEGGSDPRGEGLALGD